VVQERLVSEVVIRAGRVDDVDYLARMLYEAYFWNSDGARPTFDLFRSTSEAISRFIDGWGRAGDRAVIAVIDDLPIGAAWFRQLSADNVGYSFVDASIPCVAIAVAAEQRGRGIGGRLLLALLGQARQDGFAALTLAVEVENPAAHLYRRLGFRDDAEINGYYRMRVELSG
jgi:ribosomal protein S18 acetylase RimI-like enzyme